MKEKELNIGQRIALELLWGCCCGFALLPRWIRYYFIEDLLFGIFYYLLRYRRKVVSTNLRNAFPDKSEAERRRICRRFYRTLTEIVIDTISMTHLTDKQARKVLTIGNLDAFRAEVKGRDWVGMTAHFGCWEYFSLWGMYDPTQEVVAVYHPLHSTVMDCFYDRLRNNEHTMAVPMKESLRFYLRNREQGINGKNLVLGLIADQNPVMRPNSPWFEFLNQDTVFFGGGEKLALHCHLPVYFGGVERLQRGRYRLTFELIYDGEEEVAENEITERYVRKLEAMIRECPELWLWSHRRWKHKRPVAHAEN